MSSNFDELDLGQTIRGFAADQKLFGRYVLKSIIGRGGMGVVWRAFDEPLDRDVALKFLPELIVLDHSALDELRRETKRNLELTHHNIVRIYDFVHEGQTACISMEYVDGATLSALRVGHQEKVFEVEQLEPLVGQACQALEYAHSRVKIVHRDLKPANLMLNSRDQLKITDFGIARSLSDSVSMLSNRSSSGTLLYMSPQQLDGERPSPLDDVYSLGATLYELLTSKPPFYSGAIENQIRQKKPPSIAAQRSELNVVSSKIVPAHWEETIAACLAKDPKQRPQGAREVCERLGVTFRETGTAAIGGMIRPEPKGQLARRTQITSRPAIRLTDFWSRLTPLPARARTLSIWFVALLSFAVILAMLWRAYPNWSAEILNGKPKPEWVRSVASDRMAVAFAQGDLLRFDSKEVTVLRETAGVAEVTIHGTATTRAALFDSLANDDPVVGLEPKLAEMRTAQERARFLHERAGVDVTPVDEDAFHFVKETTPTGQTVPFRFQFKAVREGTDWKIDRIVSAVLEPTTGLPGKPITAFRNAAIVGTDKANHDKAQLARLIDTYVTDVAKGEKVAMKRLAARGLDAAGNPLFPPDRAMPGERFPETRMRTLRSDDLQSWSDDNLQYAINEVFARHGVQFNDKKLSGVFNQFSWYHPKPDSTTAQIEESLSDIEAQNVNTLHATRLARQEENAARLRQAAAAEQQRQAAVRATEQARWEEAARQAQLRAHQKAAEQAQQDEAARQIIGGILQGVINAIPRK